MKVEYTFTSEEIIEALAYKYAEVNICHNWEIIPIMPHKDATYLSHIVLENTDS